MRVDLETAFVLHTRNFTDSRVLVELFTAAHGRIGAVARSSKKSGRFALLRPFQPLLVSWQGKSELKTLIHTEAGGPLQFIQGNALYCGMYLNELLLRVLPMGDSHPAVFRNYYSAVVQLAQVADVEPVLRRFELDLLDELGYGISFDVDGASGLPIQVDAHYMFAAASGFALVPEDISAAQQGQGAVGQKGIFRGDTILAVGSQDFSQPQVRSAAKHLCRLALEPLIGVKPLKSRELFAQFNK